MRTIEVERWAIMADREVLQVFHTRIEALETMRDFYDKPFYDLRKVWIKWEEE